MGARLPVVALLCYTRITSLPETVTGGRIGAEGSWNPGEPRRDSRSRSRRRINAFPSSLSP